MSARLAVLMPVFNEALTVEQAVRSVLDCDALPDRELIIVDGEYNACFGVRAFEDTRGIRFST